MQKQPSYPLWAKVLTTSLALICVVSAITSGVFVDNSGSSAPDIPAPASARELLESVKSNLETDPDAALFAAQQLFREYRSSGENQEAQALVPRIRTALEKLRKSERAAALRSKAEAAKRQEEDRRLQILAEREIAQRKWTYGQETDQMTSETVRYASIESENFVEFDFPYEGPQKGSLTLRNHPINGKDVIFSIREGQLLIDSYQGSFIGIRFDQDKAERWEVLASSDHSTTVAFIQDYDRFLRKLRAAKNLYIQVEVYQEGSPVFEFDVSGFNVSEFRSN